MSTDTPKDEAKTERFNMFMSPSEMKAIDDWAWENRIRSKSEAVRRLIQLGMLFDEHAEGLADTALRMYENYTDKAMELAGDFAEGANDEEALNRYVKNNFAHQMSTIDEVGAFLHYFNVLLAPARAIKEDTDFDQAHLAFMTEKARALAEFLEEKVRSYEFRRDNGLLPSSDEKGEKG